MPTQVSLEVSDIVPAKGGVEGMAFSMKDKLFCVSHKNGKNQHVKIQTCKQPIKEETFSSMGSQLNETMGHG